MTIVQHITTAFLLILSVLPFTASAQTTDDYAAAAQAYNQGASIDAEPYAPPPVRYYRARVTALLGENENDDPFVPDAEQYSQRVAVEFITGPRAGETVELEYFPGTIGQNLRIGEIVIAVETKPAGETVYYITDRYRLSSIIWLTIIFFALVIVFTGWRGARSLAGLAFSLAVIIWYILPSILTGHNPFLTFLLGAFAIAVVSIYLGHGFNRRTTVAVAGTLFTLGLAIGLAVLAIYWTKLFGLGSEEAFYVQTGELAGINLRGLLLGGIIIGVLGLLDDITTAQAAVVEQLYLTDPALSFQELARRGLSVGHEHIIALVNTLALAYVGASLPLLLLFTQNYNPLWTIVNSERMTEEIVRTLIGSSALVLAVPITTYLAAWTYRRFGVKTAATAKPAHRH